METCETCKNFKVKKGKLIGFCEHYQLNRVIENYCENYDKKEKRQSKRGSKPSKLVQINTVTI